MQAVLFDLDGVIVHTAEYHFLAWRRLARHIGTDFTEEQNEQLKGVDRMGSLNRILDWGGIEKTHNEKVELAALKNSWYQEDIKKLTPADALNGVPELLEEMKQAGLRIGLGSASKNAVVILTALELLHYFETIVDGTKVTQGKPHPETFLIGAEDLKTSPEHTLVIEDSIAGLQAAQTGGFMSLGIGDAEVLSIADVVYPNFEGITLSTLITDFS